jgi:hypothetical protein
MIKATKLSERPQKRRLFSRLFYIFRNRFI